MREKVTAAGSRLQLRVQDRYALASIRARNHSQCQRSMRHRQSAPPFLTSSTSALSSGTRPLHNGAQSRAQTWQRPLHPCLCAAHAQRRRQRRAQQPCAALAGRHSLLRRLRRLRRVACRPTESSSHAGPQQTKIYHSSTGTWMGSLSSLCAHPVRTHHHRLAISIRVIQTSTGPLLHQPCWRQSWAWSGHVQCSKETPSASAAAPT